MHLVFEFSILSLCDMSHNEYEISTFKKNNAREQILDIDSKNVMTI